MPINYYSKTLSDIFPSQEVPGSLAVIFPTPVMQYMYPTQYTGNMFDLTAAQQKVSEYAQMTENWDGYGAEPVGAITSKNAERALGVLSYHVPMPDVTPNPGGTLSLEWETNAGIAHLEIGRSTCSLYIQRVADPRRLYFSGSPAEIAAPLGALLYGSLYAPLAPTVPLSQISETRHVR